MSGCGVICVRSGLPEKHEDTKRELAGAALLVYGLICRQNMEAQRENERYGISGRCDL
jgi:hypothetical protein